MTGMRRLHSVGVGIGVALGMLALGLLLGNGGEATDRGSFAISGTRPFFDARKVTLADAAKAAGVVLPRPSDALASDGSVSVVWEGPLDDGNQVLIDYTSGLYVELGPANPGMADPVYAEGVYREVAAQDDSQLGGLEQVTSVNGIPAYLVPDGAARWANGESQGAPGTVSFVLGGENVDVVGHFSNEELLRVAASVTARPST
jgi:hypothetical protein